MELKIKALSPKIGTEIPLPRFATAGAACMDLCACIDEAVTLAAGERRLVPTGIAIALPSADYAALVFAFAGQPRCDGRLLPVRLQRYGRFHLPL